MRVSMSMSLSVIMCVGHTLGGASQGASGIILDPFGFFSFVFMWHLPLNWLLRLHQLRVSWLLEHIRWSVVNLSWLEPLWLLRLHQVRRVSGLLEGSAGNLPRLEALLFLVSILLLPILRVILLFIMFMASTPSSTHGSHPFGYSSVVPVRQTRRKSQHFWRGSPAPTTEQGACPAASSLFVRVIIFFIRVLPI